MRRRGRGLVLVVLAWLVPAIAGGQIRNQTYEARTLRCLHTLCDDGTRAISPDNRTPDHWDTTITASPRQACTGHLDLRTHQVAVQCRS